MRIAKILMALCVAMALPMSLPLMPIADAQVSKLLRELGKKAPKNNRYTRPYETSPKPSRAVRPTTRALAWNEAKVTASTLNVRSCPSISCSRKRQLKQGDTIMIFVVDGEWVRITNRKFDNDWIAWQFIDNYDAVITISEKQRQ